MNRSNCVRNLEEIPIDAKKMHFANVLEGWAKLLAYGTNFVEILFEKGELEYDGHMIDVKNLKDIDSSEILSAIILILTNILFAGCSEEVGTEKLSSVLYEKNLDKNLTIETFSTMICLEKRIG